MSSGLPLELDIGCSRGHFLARTASENPDIAIIGIEIDTHRCHVAQRTLDALHLQNACIVEGDGLGFMKKQTPDSRVSAIHVYFPTPYPNGGSSSKRLFDGAFAEQAHRVLIPGGRLRIVSDHAEYFQQMRATLSGMNWWRTDWRRTPAVPWVVGTGCEWIFAGLRRKIHYAQYVKYV